MDRAIKEVIKQKLDIVEIISEYITLTPVGSRYKALSPFRNEKTPSFIVSPDMQIYKDFGGDKAGDVFQFIMDMEGVSFPEALEILAAKAGVSLRDYQFKSEANANSNKQLIEILEYSTKLYQSILAHPKYNQQALAYLRDRGVLEQSIQEFRLGLAPQNYQTIVKKLSAKYSGQSIEEAGLAIRGNKNHLYDRFRGRIMIPIQDSLARVVGFTARILPEYDDGVMGKYINSPQSRVFDKSRLLFGLTQAKLAIKSKDRVILVEGQMDVIMSHQMGIQEVVAVSGTALSEYHIKTLLRYTKNFLLAFDNDKAGLEACLRAASLITKQGAMIKVIALEGLKDAADLVRENPGNWLQAVSGAKNFVEYYLSQVMPNLKADDIAGKNASLLYILDWIEDIQDPIMKNYYIQKLANLLQIRQEDVYSKLKSKPVKLLNPTQPVIEAPSPAIKLQQYLIGYLFYKPQNYAMLSLEESLFTQPRLRELFVKLRDYYHHHQPAKLVIADLQAILSPAETEVLEKILLSVRHKLEETALTDEQVSEIIQETIQLMQNHYNRSVRRKLRSQLAEAKQSGDTKKIAEILKQYNTFIKHKL